MSRDHAEDLPDITEPLAALIDRTRTYRADPAKYAAEASVYLAEIAARVRTYLAGDPPGGEFRRVATELVAIADGQRPDATADDLAEILKRLMQLTGQALRRDLPAIIVSASMSPPEQGRPT